MGIWYEEAVSMVINKCQLYVLPERIHFNCSVYSFNLSGSFLLSQTLTIANIDINGLKLQACKDFSPYSHRSAHGSAIYCVTRNIPHGAFTSLNPPSPSVQLIGYFSSKNSNASSVKCNGRNVSIITANSSVAFAPILFSTVPG